jgi:hypothetical protein
VDFFVSLAELFASIGMSVADVVTGLLAVIAIVVSIGTLIQTAVFRPKPHFWIEWAEEAFQFNGVVVTVCRFGNDGDIPARNVRVTVHGKGIFSDLKYWDQIDKFDDGDRLGFEVPLEPARRGWDAPLSDQPRTIYPIDMDAAAPRLTGFRPGTEYLRPTVKIKYRGRWRKAKSRAPKTSRLSFMHSGNTC